MNIHVTRLGARAAAVNASLDNMSAPQIKDIENYRKFMEETLEQPTIGMIAKDTFINSQSKHNPVNFYLNRKMVERLDDMKQLQRDFSYRMRNLYPNTSKARQYIVDESRLSLDYVKKSKGYNFIDKLKILLK